jgi:hypothetical protein
MNPQAGWAKNLTGSVLALAFLGAAGMFFGMGAGYSWLARHLPWWAFALVFTGGMFFNSFTYAIRKTRRDRRAAAARRQRTLKAAS